MCARMNDMIWIPAQRFVMGSDAHYPEERSAHPVHVDGFWMDRSPVTNTQFAAFVTETRYTTVAERTPNANDYPGAISEMLRPGSMVFVRPRTRPPRMDIAYWWQYVFGADWKHPQGPDSSLDGLAEHPVVHVAYEDVAAFATWAGKSIASEAEWEAACRGGQHAQPYAWGDELTPNGVMMANYWQGEFPHDRVNTGHWETTSPTGAFPPNAYGLYDMIGNVWEWTSDWFAPQHSAVSASCCAPANPRGGTEAMSVDPREPTIRIPRKVLKGGSHLCAPNYCQRYRPAARHAQPVDTSTSHIGFRCVVRP